MTASPVAVRIGSAVLLAALTACGSPGRGTVVAKDYDPAYAMTQCNLVGKVTVCSPRYYPEVYLLMIRYGDDAGWRSVDGETWRRTEVGEFVNFGD